MADDRPLARNVTTALLTAVYPAGIDWRIAVPDRRLEIGRQSSSDVPPLAHPTVSRAHVAIRPDPAGGYLVRDLGSQNGSSLGGTPLSSGAEVALSDGALLRIGDVLLVCEIDELGDRPTAAAAVGFEAIAGRSMEMARVRSHIARAATDPAPLLLVGETGTGKERIAREAHRLSGRPGAFVAVNCAALDRQLADSQLFGNGGDDPGFFRAADRGTLLLDAIGELPADLQPKLLRALQQSEIHPAGAAAPIAVDVRVIAATNRDLANLVDAGDFRRDLYARLALWELELPPLRQRRADILDWVERLHRRWHQQRGSEYRPLDLSADAAAAVVLHSWPENLRGIERLVRAIAPINDGGDGSLGHGDLPSWITDKPTVQTTALSFGARSVKAPAPRRPIPGAEEFAAALEELRGNISAMAKRFGRDRRQIYRWLESYGLEQRRQELIGN